MSHVTKMYNYVGGSENIEIFHYLVRVIFYIWDDFKQNTVVLGQYFTAPWLWFKIFFFD